MAGFSPEIHGNDDRRESRLRCLTVEASGLFYMNHVDLHEKPGFMQIYMKMGRSFFEKIWFKKISYMSNIIACKI